MQSQISASSGKAATAAVGVQGSASDVRLSEDEGVPQLRYIGLFAQEIEEPRTIPRLAIEDRADDAVLFEDKTLVDAVRSITQHDILTILGLAEIACREQVDAGDLQLGGCDGTSINSCLVTRELRGKDLSHFVERRYEAIA